MTWSPSPATIAASQTFVGYDIAPPWSGGAGCAPATSPGVTALSQHLRALFPQIVTTYSLDCRPNTANGAQTSLHGVGRALDLMVRPGSRDGDAIAAWLVEHAAEIGVQYLVWDRVAFSPSRPTNKLHPYTGPNPHSDHVHVELTNAGAMQTPWFTSTPELPSSTPWPAIIAVGVVAAGAFVWLSR